MNSKASEKLSVTLATIAGICFISGLVILSK